MISFTVLKIHRYDEDISVEAPKDINVLISLDGDNGNKEIFKRYISLFNRSNPNFQMVPFFATSDVEAMLKLIYVKEANQKYDIAYLSGEQIYSLIELDLIEPIDSYVMKDFGVNWLEEMLPVSMANSTAYGKLWSIPTIRNARVVLFNKEIINYYNDAITLKELFLLTQEEYMKTGEISLLMPISEILIQYISYDSPFSSIALNERGRYINIFSEDKVNMLDLVEKTIESKSIKSYTQNGMKGIEEFLKGNIGILVSNTYYANKVLSNVDFSISYIPLMLDEGTTFPMLGGNLYLLKQSNNLGYIDSWDVLQGFWKVITEDSELVRSNHMPLTFSQKENCLSREEPPNPSYINTIKRNYNGYSGMAINQNTKINLLLENMLGNIINRKEATAVVLKEVQDIINNILDE